VIESADEFVRLRTSEDPADYGQAAHDEAEEATWHEVIDGFPEMRFWVAQNKTVPLSILERLRQDADERVVPMVRMKRAWARAHPEDSIRPSPIRDSGPCKTFKGMTDEMLRWQTERFNELATHREGHVVHLRPEQVVEVAFDGVQPSTRYPGGMALRFARVVRYRDDKPVEEVDTVDHIWGIAATRM